MFCHLHRHIEHALILLIVAAANAAGFDVQYLCAGRSMRSIFFAPVSTMARDFFGGIP
jgi:hypothetical protein